VAALYPLRFNEESAAMSGFASLSRSFAIDRRKSQAGSATTKAGSGGVSVM
jgi:hypothetical protein